MKKIMFSVLIATFAGMAGFAINTSNTMIIVEAKNGQLLEMPAYIESEVIEIIPGVADELFLFCQSDLRKKNKESKMIQADLSSILLCINKPEIDEPLPFELN